MGSRQRLCLNARRRESPLHDDFSQPTSRPTTSAAASQDFYADLMKLEELLDAGVLTQEEFDAQKVKILAS
jgi:hypothetical protein